MFCFAVTVARSAPERTSARLRLPSYAVWDTAVFLLNVLAFVYIGLQLRPILAGLDPDVRIRYLRVAGLVLATVIVTRIVFVLMHTSIVLWKNRRFGFRPARPGQQPPTFKGGVVVMWAGMRGIISLAAAAALAHCRGRNGVSLPRPHRPDRVCRGDRHARHSGIDPAAAPPGAAPRGRRSRRAGSRGRARAVAGSRAGEPRRGRVAGGGGRTPRIRSAPEPWRLGRRARGRRRLARGAPPARPGRGPARRVRHEGPGRHRRRRLPPAGGRVRLDRDGNRRTRPESSVVRSLGSRVPIMAKKKKKAPPKRKSGGRKKPAGKSKSVRRAARRPSAKKRARRRLPGSLPRSERGPRQPRRPRALAGPRRVLARESRRAGGAGWAWSPEASPAIRSASREPRSPTPRAWRSCSRRARRSRRAWSTAWRTRPSGELRTREVPEDDVPQEYLDED